MGRCAYGAAQPFEALRAPLCVRYDDGARDPLGPVALEVGRRPVAIDVLGAYRWRALRACVWRQRSAPGLKPP